MRNALVITPYATVPADSTRRRRVAQTARLLADNGFAITLVLLAWENGWRVRHQDREFQQLRRQWDEVLLVYGDPRIGCPPRDGQRHQVDEWWDFNLENLLRNLLSRRSYDVCLVNQVWLSRAFDLLDEHRTVRVLDAPDLLSRRAMLCDAAGIEADGFRPEPETELFGMERADIVLVGSEQDAAELARRSEKRILPLPFYDAALEAQSGTPRIPQNDGGPVRFGVYCDGIGNANLKALVSALESAATQPPPMQLVLTGACDPPDTRIPIRMVPAGDTPAAFYREIDCVVAPQFYSAGIDAGAADAAATGTPLVASPPAKAAVGADRSLVFDSADALATRMAEISLSPSLLATAGTAALELRDRLRGRVARGTATLLEAIRRATEPLILDLGRADLFENGLILLGYLSDVGLLGCQRPVIVVLAPNVLAALGAFLPPAVTPVLPDALASALDETGGRPVLVEVTGSAAEEAARTAKCRVIRDRRWTNAPADHEGRQAALAALPFFHSNVEREPAAHELRRLWLRRNASTRDNPPGRARFLFVGGTEGAAAPAGAERWLRPRIIPLADAAAFHEAAMCLLLDEGEEVAWLAEPAGYQHRLIVQICALRDIPLWTLLGEVGVCSGPLPRRARAEFDRVCEQQLRVIAAVGDSPAGSTVNQIERSMFGSELYGTQD